MHQVLFFLELLFLYGVHINLSSMSLFIFNEIFTFVTLHPTLNYHFSEFQFGSSFFPPLRFYLSFIHCLIKHLFMSFQLNSL